MFASSLVAILNEVATSGKGAYGPPGDRYQHCEDCEGKERSRQGRTYTANDVLETWAPPPTPFSKKSQAQLQQRVQASATPTILSSWFYPAPQSIHNTSVNQRRRPFIYETHHLHPPPKNTVGKTSIIRVRVLLEKLTVVQPSYVYGSISTLPYSPHTTSATWNQSFEGAPPHILNVSTRWRQVVSLKLRSLHPRYPLYYSLNIYSDTSANEWPW